MKLKAMFVFGTDLNVIRFDVNEQYLQNGILLDKQKILQYELGKNEDGYSLRLRYRINVIDSKTDDELLGYLGERMFLLNPSTISNDKPILLQAISEMVFSAESYCQQNSRVPISGENELNVLKTANDIFSALKQKGLYQ